MRDGLLISILSLLKYSNSPLKIYVLTAHLRTENHEYFPIEDADINLLTQLVESSSPESSLTKIDITELMEAEPPIANENTRFTPNCMLRLYADEVAELPDRILYLDTDVVCCKDFSDFYYQDLTGFEMAGTLDRYGKWFFHNKMTFFDYINSGVMLLNLAFIRQDGLFTKCRKLCQNKRMFMPDQSAVNKLTGAKKIVPNIYNEQKKLTDETVFRHFTTSFKFFPYLKVVTVKPWETKKNYLERDNASFEEIIDDYKLLVDEVPDE